MRVFTVQFWCLLNKPWIIREPFLVDIWRTHLVAQSSSQYRVSCGDIVQVAIYQGVSIGVTFQPVAWEHVCWFDFFK